MSDHLRAHDAALERLQRLHPKIIDLGLERVARLCAALDHPERRLPPVIHVAGTNGKGSTVAFIRAMAEAAGLSVHAFTSPHLVRFAERIRLAGTLITDAALAEVLDRVEAANAGEPITFFEVTTAAAFLAMAETPADLAVIEVGLGGRFDATNIVTPAVSVITPIDYDHAEFLGTELAGIAREKAGVIKSGVPVVVASQPFAVMDVIEHEVGPPKDAPLIDFEPLFSIPAVEQEWIERQFVVTRWIEAGRLQLQWGNRHFDLPAPSLPGAHQFDNAAVAAIALLVWGDPRIDDAALARGMETARWPARMQRLTAGPLATLAAARGSDLWLDGGHNPHGARAVAEFARSLQARDGRPLTLIVGLLARKDVAGVFAAFAGLSARIVTTGFDAPAAADPAELAEAARAQGLDATPAPNVAAALTQALAGEGAAPHVIVCGSLYLAGEILAMTPETWPS